jgi:hypothetical protein
VEDPSTHPPHIHCFRDVSLGGWVSGWHIVLSVWGEGSSGDSIILSEQSDESPLLPSPCPPLTWCHPEFFHKKNKLFNRNPICGRMKDLLDPDKLSALTHVSAICITWERSELFYRTNSQKSGLLRLPISLESSQWLELLSPVPLPTRINLTSTVIARSPASAGRRSNRKLPTWNLLSPSIAVPV